MILQYWQSGVFPYWSEVFDERNKKPLKVSSYRDQSTKDDSVQCIARVNIFLAIKILMDLMDLMSASQIHWLSYWDS